MSRASKGDKFKRLLEARRTGTIVAHSSDEEDTSIYDEVDEDTFRQKKRQQLMQDDFIVDDNGEGYVDTGGDEWDASTRPNYYSDEEESGKKRKRSKPPKKGAKVSTTADINSFFTVDSGAKVAPKPVTAAADIDDILDDFDAPIAAKKSKVFGGSAAKSKKSTSSNFGFFSSGPARPKKNRNTARVKAEHPSSPTWDADLDLDMDAAPIDIDTADNVDIKPNFDADADADADSSQTQTQPPTRSVSPAHSSAPPPKTEIPATNNDSGNDSDSDDEVVVRRRPKTTTATAAAAPRVLASVSAVKAADIADGRSAVAASGVGPAAGSRNSAQPSYSTISQTQKLDSDHVVADGAFKMFWLDYAEADNSILLFGKVLAKDGTCASAVVQVNGMCRELFALPRPFRVVDGQPTDTPVTARDVHEEIAPLLIKHFGLEKLRAKPEKMKYAFELPGIPKNETEYLKILLPYKTSKQKHLVLPGDLTGETFSRVFGTNTNIFESFVMQRNIMGPCWLEIKNGDFGALQNASHCHVEVAVESADCVSPLPNIQLPTPPLTAVAISVQTMMNAKANKQEIACISMATYRNVPQDSPVEETTPPDSTVTLVRPIGAAVFPPGLKQAAEKKNLALRALPNEASMLGCLAALVKSADPDVIIGHRLENISLDVLVHRMHDLRVATWSAMGRRNRKQWPEKFGKGGGFNNNLLIREIFQGRLLCDIANELGQSLTPKCQSWDLPEMYEVVCHKDDKLPEINFNNPQYAEDAAFLLNPLLQNSKQVQMAAEISFATQILSLSKQLTNLAGNAWSHTLSGTRAGRNEYILLHEFKRNNYIVPDKEDKYHKNTNPQQEAKLEANDDDATTVTSNKKPKYQGGLVFDPEKGLHKNYILVMDFNSLYPSIIQEYNICFTTVVRDAYNVSHNEEKDMPDLPARESEAGVLPRLLNTLVSRRREVKKLLKDPRISASERAQYDIKQQALKLTANSMYGCLGYVNSRFYAKPLAMLVTNKGREILMDTKTLADSIGLRVVYGDTDSVMIDTNATTLTEAFKIGDDFKVKVNEQYKLLEIDTDNVFKRLLLHAKKKYAAMNVTLDKNGKETLSLEVKGLDMKRREYCQVSKDMSTEVLETLLSEKDPEVALVEIYAYLEKMNAEIRNMKIPIEKFVINTRLSKDPTNYPAGNTMPAVQVALRLRKQGKVIKAGSVLTYVITESTDKEETPAQRARAIQEILINKDAYKPDFDFYMEKQIFAPVERLVSNINGIDMTRVVKALGLDDKKFVRRINNAEDSGFEISPLNSNMSDAERFRNVSFLVLKCKCGIKFRFGGITASPDYTITFHGIQCSKCHFQFSQFTINAQLVNEICRHISNYYDAIAKCSDPACGIETRQVSVYGKRCIGNNGTARGCKGIMKYKYSSGCLYNQLLYFVSIFDVDKAKAQKLKPICDDGLVTPMNTSAINALAEQNRTFFESLQAVAQNYIDLSGYQKVGFRPIFDYMTPVKQEEQKQAV